VASVLSVVNRLQKRKKDFTPKQSKYNT